MVMNKDEVGEGMILSKEMAVEAFSAFIHGTFFRFMFCHRRLPSCC